MSSSISNLATLPKQHPLKEYLAKLPVDQTCDPNPDWIECGSPCRYILAFRSDNASARLRRLEAMLKRDLPNIPIVTSHITHNQSFLILMVTQVQPVGELIQFPLALTEAKPIEHNKTIPGCREMPTY